MFVPHHHAPYKNVSGRGDVRLMLVDMSSPQEDCPIVLTDCDLKCLVFEFDQSLAKSRHSVLRARYINKKPQLVKVEVLGS